MDLAQYTICHNSMKQQSEALSDKISAATISRDDKLQEMTDMVDTITADTKQFIISYGLMKMP